MTRPGNQQPALSGKVDPAKSINALGGNSDVLGPYYDGMVERHETTLATPIGQLDTTAIANMIAHDYATEVIVRYLIDQIRENPASGAHGDYYLGVLVHDVPQQFWLDHKDLQAEAVAAILAGDDSIPEDYIDSAIFFLEMNDGGPLPKFGWLGERLD